MIDTIICGDCLEVMPNIPNNSVDMVLADLPYGTTKLKWDSLIPLEPLWHEISRVTKDESALAFTASQPFTTTLVASNIKQFRHEWIWKRHSTANFLHVKYQPFKGHENIVVFSKHARTIKYNPIKSLGKAYTHKHNITKLKNADYGGGYTPTGFTEYNGERNPQSVIELDSHNGGRYHATQKPVALFEYLIRTYTNEGDTVLDPTCGSGTTAVACHESNRHYICIEKEPEYCAIAEKRIAEVL